MKVKFRDLLAALDFHSRVVREYKNVKIVVSDRFVTVDRDLKSLALSMGGEIVPIASQSTQK